MFSVLVNFIFLLSSITVQSFPSADPESHVNETRAAPTQSSKVGLNRAPSCRCGVSTGTRIVNGQNASPNEYPWQVRLIIYKPYSPPSLCGGTIIDSFHVLTAAHCTQDASYISVYVSDHNQAIPDGEIQIPAAHYVIHPYYRLFSRFDYDFSIIRLAYELDFSGTRYKALPVCLPVYGGKFSNVQATTTGWGELGNQQTSQILQEVSVQTMSNSECINRMPNNLKGITPNMICAGGNGVGSCRGDSGGPLTTQVNGQSTLIGVTSFGAQVCAISPTVYARVTAQYQWITANSGGEDCDTRR